jgi:segregation and condensation protein A
VDLTTDLLSADGGFVVELERFQGPLDLLLHLIRQQDIDIFDIPISQITHQFLAAIEGVTTLGLDRAGEFLEMAATLIRIKAQMLLPRRSSETGELEDPRAELVRRLLEYEHFREVAQRLESAQADRARHFARGYVPPRKEPEQVIVQELTTTWDEVFGAALHLEERVSRAPAEHRVTPRTVPIEEKIGLIVQTLVRVTRIEFRSLVEPFHDKLHAVVTFMAGLELSKRRQVALRQREPFASLWFYKLNEQDFEPGEAQFTESELVDDMTHVELAEEGTSVE